MKNPTCTPDLLKLYLCDSISIDCLKRFCLRFSAVVTHLCWIPADVKLASTTAHWMLAYTRVVVNYSQSLGQAEHRNWIFELISDSCWSTLSLIRVRNNSVQESFNELWVVMSSLCFITVEFNCCFRCVHAVFWERVMCFILLDGTGWMLDEYSMNLDECSMNAPKTRWMLDDCSMNARWMDPASSIF